MDLEIYKRTKENVPQKDIDLIRGLLQHAGKVLKLKDNTEMSVTIMDNAQMQRMNKKYRGVNRATDVISFPINESNSSGKDFPLKLTPEMKAELPKNLGDIFISIDKVAEQAEFLQHSKARELGYLVVHGFLHLNGYDHIKPEDQKVMFPLQRKILDSYGLTK
ncbi:rRNA maturation RNase YbeY [Acetilactobacillus jinshanensis]|uniref:Endoribonuclease YbeY n=1 Tax=Acetilactobacillus jinshanensis TaxID=1720083 RepID=A0A4P6ZKM5_9LACO|nr:rRNA maturation RNase YbeY [Acetilactobacillus jinshanensis]QBP17982.1 rRNA maturation RNase YbeY [Acetilactobacillus jinshanensis]URL60844.1 rRNA maturation RNase YbeY [uncultured bacterium]